MIHLFCWNILLHVFCQQYLIFHAFWCFILENNMSNQYINIYSAHGRCICSYILDICCYNKKFFSRDDKGLVFQPLSLFLTLIVWHHFDFYGTYDNYSRSSHLTLTHVLNVVMLLVCALLPRLWHNKFNYGQSLS